MPLPDNENICFVSPPAREAWIEIFNKRTYRRGGRMSPPAREAWIEMAKSGAAVASAVGVASRKGGVD